MNYQTVLDFWFDEISPEQWWIKDPSFDREIKARFLDLHKSEEFNDLIDSSFEKVYH